MNALEKIAGLEQAIEFLSKGSGAHAGYYGPRGFSGRALQEILSDLKL